MSPARRVAEEAAGHYRLPSGRHGLPREVVVSNQRARLVAGMIAVVSEHGYDGATMNRIVEVAGVSKRTFYCCFSGKEECFFDAFDTIAGHLDEAMAAAGAEDEEWPGLVGSRLAALLEILAANPDLVRFTMIAPSTARGAVAERHRAFLAGLLAALVADMPADVPATPSAGVEEGLMGAVAALIVRAVRAGEGDRLPLLLPDLLELVLTPYVGRQEAGRAARAAATG